MNYFYLFVISFALCACQPKKQSKISTNANINLTYAKGFSYEKHSKYTKITVHTPYKNATTPYEYLLVKGDTVITPTQPNQFVIQLPIQNLIATSTTQIPVFEALESESLLKGFPNTRFVSSKKTRTLIDKGGIVDVGQNEAMNTELILGLQPDVLFAFAVDQLNKNFTTLKKAGIPLVVDASWLEESPLGRAEWIKFFALFLDKEKEANTVFQQIEVSYTTALKSIQKDSSKPKILYGSMFNGIWYAPAGESYVAKILNDAQTDYLWKNTLGTGSLSLQFEQVFIEANQSDFWLAPGVAVDLETLKNQNKHYAQLRPFQNKKVFTYTNTTGATGGFLFFELSALRPDLVLKDVIKICHPNTLPTYETTFFKQLE